MIYIDESVMTYDDFKTIFKEHYWDIRKQSEIRNKVINGHYNPKTDQSMGEHMMKVAQIAKFLEPPIEEKELISLIAGHFPSEIRSAIIVARLNNLKEAMKLLKDLQGYGEPNHNTGTDSNGDRNFRRQTYQNRNDGTGNQSRYQNGYRGTYNNNRHNNYNNNQGNRGRNGNNDYPRRNNYNYNHNNNNYRVNEAINHIQFENRRSNQEVTQGSNRREGGERLHTRGNMRGSRGRNMRLGQRTYYSDQDGNGDYSDDRYHQMKLRVEWRVITMKGLMTITKQKEIMIGEGPYKLINI